MAGQHAKPSWLSKPGFLAFGALRSYPLGQHRRLCAALQQRTLPLAAPSVLALVRQSLYHLGELRAAGGGELQLPWRTGWQEEGGVLPTLCSELRQLAEELEQAPREHEQLLLLGEVAAFLSGWHGDCRAVARRFAAMSSEAVEQLEAQLAEVVVGGRPAAWRSGCRPGRPRRAAWRCCATRLGSSAAPTRRRRCA
jgi:hypothetical protein